MFSNEYFHILPSQAHPWVGCRPVVSSLAVQSFAAIFNICIFACWILAYLHVWIFACLHVWIFAYLHVLSVNFAEPACLKRPALLKLKPLYLIDLALIHLMIFHQFVIIIIDYQQCAVWWLWSSLELHCLKPLYLIDLAQIHLMIFHQTIIIVLIVIIMIISNAPYDYDHH